MKPLRGLHLLLLGLLTGACAPELSSKRPGSDPLSTSHAPVAPATAPPLDNARAKEAHGIEVPTEPALLITEPEVLRALEQDGLSFAQLVLGSSGTSLAELRDTQRMRALSALLRKDIASIQRSDSNAGVGMRFSHRLFDASWLESKHTHFELVGVVNRLDRDVFAPEHCGETRLVYRLAYRTEKVSSRLPMTINVVFYQPRSEGAAANTACLESARRWQREGSGATLAKALRAADGPLHASLLTSDALKSVEVNVQTVRWPSTTRPDMAGHAQYALHVLLPDGQTLVPSPLENTPRPNLSATERDSLRTWVAENLEAIDLGIARMPERFADTESVSVTPLGLGRLKNRPFGSLFNAADFAALDLSAFKNISTPNALLRRLDGLSCAGCHQTRSVAGFHLLGEEPVEKKLDALFVPGSPHLFGELPRRRGYAKAVLEQRAADPMRPHADHEPGAGGFGSHCTLGDTGLSAFRCAAGLRCESHGDPLLGTCVPDGPGGAGAACEVGVLQAHKDPLRDRVRSLSEQACARGVCNDNRVGFPQGMCTTSCSGLQAGEGCGAIVALRPFNDCIARGEPFTQCVERTASPAGMRACSADAGCRDDYICARGQHGTGTCIPPYFLFQLRVDGHVLPR